MALQHRGKVEFVNDCFPQHLLTSTNILIVYLRTHLTVLFLKLKKIAVCHCGIYFNVHLVNFLVTTIIIIHSFDTKK